MVLPDKQKVEQLVEIITREVLVAMMEQQQGGAPQPGEQCKLSCADGLCVKTCFDRAGQVISAGAERLTSTLGIIPEDISLAKMIDHTLLKADATPDQIAQLCYEARKYNFASVCINPRSEEHTSELQSPKDLVCRHLLEKKKQNYMKRKNKNILNRRCVEKTPAEQL